MLHWKIVSTPVSEFFPLGVKSTYFAYPTDEAIEIVKSSAYKRGLGRRSKYVTGLEPIRTRTVERPTSEDNNGGPPGMIALYFLPEGVPEVADFKQVTVKDSKGAFVAVNVVDHLKKMVKAISDAHGSGSDTYKQWLEFLNVFPKADAKSYIESDGNNYKIPFITFFDGSNPALQQRKKVLYSGTHRNVDTYESSEGMPIAKAQATVEWGPFGKGWLHHKITVQKEARVILNHESFGLTSPYLHVTEDDECILDSMPYEAMLNSTLQKNCKRMGLNPIGDKLDLVKRLREYEDFIAKVKAGAINLKPSKPYERMTAKELQEVLKTCGLSKSGSKDQLLKRLKDALLKAEITEEFEDEAYVNTQQIYDGIQDAVPGIRTGQDVIVDVSTGQDTVVIANTKAGIAQLLPNSKPFEDMSVAELKSVLKLCKLSQTGKKEDLLRRLKDALNDADIKLESKIWTSLAYKNDDDYNDDDDNVNALELSHDDGDDEGNNDEAVCEGDGNDDDNSKEVLNDDDVDEYDEGNYVESFEFDEQPNENPISSCDDEESVCTQLSEHDCNLHRMRRIVSDDLKEEQKEKLLVHAATVL